jgi:hypothetical protein
VGPVPHALYVIVKLDELHETARFRPTRPADRGPCNRNQLAPKAEGSWRWRFVLAW